MSKLNQYVQGIDLTKFFVMEAKIKQDLQETLALEDSFDPTIGMYNLGKTDTLRAVLDALSSLKIWKDS